MDLLTHALMGAQAARLGADESTRLGARERLLLGAGAAAFPDLDFVGFLVDPLRFLAHWHQGPTHSLLLLPLWALLLGALFSAATRRRQVLGEAVLVCALGLATHLALDLITAYGTQLWYPLSERRFSLGLFVAGVPRPPWREPGSITCYRWDGVLPGDEEIQRAVTEAVSRPVPASSTPARAPAPTPAQAPATGQALPVLGVVVLGIAVAVVARLLGVF